MRISDWSSDVCSSDLHFTGAGQLSASMTLLSYLAGLTTRMRLGTGVTVLPWHNPVLMAEQAATVDVVSDGRLDFGIGRGYRPNEFHGFMVDPATAPARFRSEEHTSELQSLMRISY